MAKAKSSTLKKKRFNFNIPALIFQIAGMCLLAVAMVLPFWLVNGAGLNFYTSSRNWGLLYVVGKVRRSHWETTDIACRSRMQMSAGVSCLTALCNWYAGKCAAYKAVALVSITIFSVLCGVELLVFISLFLSFIKTINMLRLASALCLLATVAGGCSAVAYVYGMDHAFVMANNGGYYPVPQPGTSFILLCVASAFFGIATVVHFSRFMAVRREENYTEEMRAQRDSTLIDLGIAR